MKYGKYGIIAALILAGVLAAIDADATIAGAGRMSVSDDVGVLPTSGRDGNRHSAVLRHIRLVSARLVRDPGDRT